MTQNPPKAQKSGARKQRPAPEGSRLGREVLGLCAIFGGLIVILSLATFDSRDPWINHSLSSVTKIHNKAGEFGAYISGSLFDFFGMGAWLLPAYFCTAGARRILGTQKWLWWRWFGFILLALCVCIVGAASDTGAVSVFSRGTVWQNAGDVSSHGGGIVGHMLYGGLSGFMGPVGTFLVWLCLLLLAVQMLTGMSWLSMGALAVAFMAKSAQELALRFSDFRRERREARIARAGRRAEEAFDLVAIEGLPKDTGFAEYDGEDPVSRGKTYAMPQQDEGADTDDFLDKLERLDQEYARNSRTHFGDFQEAAPEIFVEEERRTTEIAHGTAPVTTVDTSLVHPALLQQHAGEEDYEDLPRTAELPARADGEAGTAPSPFRHIDDDEDFLHALWRSAGHEVTPVEDLYPQGIASPQDRAGKEESRAVAASAPVPAVSERSPGPFAEERRPEPDEEEDEDDSLGNIPIYVAEEIEAAPEEPRPGFVSSVLNRMKRTERIPLPSLELLQAASTSAQSTPRHVLEGKGKSLMTCLKDFNVQGELVGITPGPVVTMFEVRPAPGVRVSRIANLSDDLALALKAVAVRIQAPVPGTDTVGIEIPNEIRETVCLKELLGSQLFNSSKSLLTLALGKDIAGNPAVADLATMPHLLVAGATGAGKSVGINSIILSLLYKARPHEVKLLLIDPKRVEMAIYADLPHLVHPVVTEMQLAKNALEWAVAEMEQRYNAIARAGVRNIADYNAKVASFGDKPPEGLEDLSFMPYLVLIIDELADLMLVAAKEVETSIVRLAQLARAAGIHLILATQRPSVDVVTGLIKANFPCRISFQVTSKHDSRTILDSVGAEHLLGKGDMLFKPGGGKFQRMHGAFVSDKDVNAVVSYWKSQLRPEYSIDFADWSSEGTVSVLSGGGNGNGGGGDVASDPMYNEAVDFVRQQGKASISLIQRKFRIGFNKAARYVEQMEQDGIIGPADGSKPRLVIR